MDKKIEQLEKQIEEMRGRKINIGRNRGKPGQRRASRYP